MKQGVIIQRGFLRCLLGVSAVLALSGLAATAHADGTPRGQAIASSNACMGCHAVYRKLVGPSFQLIAAKYKGDAEAPV